jgi:arginyl-tRNA synthetase
MAHARYIGLAFPASQARESPPRDPAHGDMATNAAMVLAKHARMKAR